MIREFECKCTGLIEHMGRKCMGCLANTAIREAVAAERERCAAVAQTMPFESWEMDDGARDRIAAAIRE